MKVTVDNKASAELTDWSAMQLCDWLREHDENFNYSLADIEALPEMAPDAPPPDHPPPKKAEPKARKK